VGRIEAGTHHKKEVVVVVEKIDLEQQRHSEKAGPELQSPSAQCHS
jgi:hypothetical protein